MRALLLRILLLLPLLAAPLHAQRAESLRPPALPRASAAGIPAYGGGGEERVPWLSRDKALHFGISAAGTAGLYAAGRRLGLSRRAAGAVSVLLVGAAGVWREVGTSDPDDRLTRAHLSRRDLVWDAAGIAVGLTFADRWLGPRGQGNRE